MKNNTAFTVSLDGRQIRRLLIALTLSALLLRLMIAYATVHFFDLSFYVDWSAGARSDLFGAYERVENLDYPPLFLFPLTLTGHLMENPLVRDTAPMKMLALKGWQVLFDAATIPLIYAVLQKRGVGLGLAGAALWAVNPTIILNSSYWGQTDSIMLFLLTLCFWLLLEQRAEWAAVVMALACLMKFQSLYFAPLFALYLLTRFPPRRIFAAACCGAATVYAVFYPFLLRSGWDLPLRIYLGGFEQYPGASLNAFNYYTACGLNYRHIDTVMLGGVTAEQLSAFMLLAALALLVFLYLTSTGKSPWLLGFLFIQTVFLFTTRMHERYQIPAVLFSLLACLWHRDAGLFWSYVGVTAMTFLNHLLVLEYAFSGEADWSWMAHFEQISILLSYVNLLLFILTAYLGVRALYRYGRFRLPGAFRCALPERWRGGRSGLHNKADGS